MHAPAGERIFGWQPQAARLCAAAALYACFVLDVRGCCDFRLPALELSKLSLMTTVKGVLLVGAGDERVGDFNLTGHGEEDVVVLCTKATKDVVVDYLIIVRSC